MRSGRIDRPTARRVRRAALALVIGAATGLSGMGIAHASPNLSATPAAPTSAGQVITLITGEQILLRADGSYSVVASPGSTGSLNTYRTGTGDRYFVPSMATPYLGGELDPSLFDANALTAANATGQVPLTLTFAAGSTPTAPAGVTLTSVSGSTATGYVTTASGPAFAAALRASVGADHANGKPAGSTPLVPGLTHIGLAGAATPPVATPHYPLHILQVNTNDLTGKPSDFAFVYLVDGDNVRAFTSFVPIDAGIGKVAVPAGTYTAIVGFDDIDSKGNLASTHTVLQDVTVPSTGNASATVNESAATSQVGVAVPKPANAQFLITNYLRLDAAGNGASFAQLNFGAPPPTYISPTAAPANGTLDYLVNWIGTSPDPTQNYRYDVAFGSAKGVPANEQDTVTDNQLAIVHDHFSADPATKKAPGSLLVGASDPLLARFGGWSAGGPAPMPGDLTDYLASSVGGDWLASTFGANGLVFQGDLATYATGRQYDVDWSHGPIAPNLGRHTGTQFCIACSAGSTLELGVNAIGDSDPTHAGLLFTQPTSSHFTLYRDGTKVFDQDGYDGAELQNVPTTAATYRGVFDLSLAGVAGISQSTVTHTDLTVRYDPNATKGSTLPSESTCPGASATTPCVVLPALNLGYQLSSDESNGSGRPVQVLKLRVGHVSYDGAGSHAPITSACVSVSFDNGATWEPVPTIGFAGNYVALWANPSSGGSPSIKVTATDANGGSITQTVTNAYTIEGATS
ncbi:MAG TPA: hypothetical protein VG247_23795 [Pseudonocardiaceae bacterium]|nr:hypothetical protein [Pseudonocardiaceae bacterium]